MKYLLLITFSLLSSAQVFADGKVKIVGVSEFNSRPLDLFNGQPWEASLRKDVGSNTKYWKINLRQDGAVFEVWAERQFINIDGNKFQILGEHLIPKQKFDLVGEELVKPTVVKEERTYKSCNLAPEMTESYLFIRSYFCEGKKVTADTWCDGRQRMLTKTFTTETQVKLVLSAKGAAPQTLPTKPTESIVVQKTAQSRECEAIPANDFTESFDPTVVASPQDSERIQ